MKTGLSVEALAKEIFRQQDAKRDFLVPTKQLGLFPRGDEKNPEYRLMFGDHDFGINDVAHQQIAEYTKIPKVYYDKMRAEAPALLGKNVREWFEKYPATRLVRTLDGVDRAFLSDRYRNTGLENADVAKAALPALIDIKAEIMSCDITEKRLYIKAVDPRIKQDIPKGKRLGDGSHSFFDTVSPAVIISNSEVGFGAFHIDFGVYTKVCTNLATISKAGMKRTHIGGRLEAGVDLTTMLTDETVAAKNHALLLEMRDSVKAAFDLAQFEAHCDKLRGMTEQQIDGKVEKVVELTTKKFGFTQDDGSAILKHLIEGSDLSRYGLFNAVTRTGQDVESYDKASEFEYAGGKLIDMPASEWKELAKAE